MAVLVKHTGPGAGFLQQMGDKAASEQNRVLALVKGSCEVLRPCLLKEPEGLGKLQQKLTNDGLRVLCLAAKEVSESVAKADPEHVDRQDLERDLEFCGLLVLRNSIKQHTVATIRQLRRSYHRVIMITGDHPLTACQVARHVSMADRPFLELEPVSRDTQKDAELLPGASGLLQWRNDVDPDKPMPFEAAAVEKLAREYSLCLPGRALALLSEDQIDRVVQFFTVFARVSPQQKEQVIVSLNKISHTMMVGDGTNDVGALKNAHVGVSLLTSTGPALPSMAAAHEARRPKTMHNHLDDQVQIVRLGDASIASPFTYKGDSVKCSTHILKCGRATLATVLMMYKILGLNSIMSAFAMSFLTLDGVKLGDGQTAVESLFTSMCFFLVSRSEPAKQLAKQLPTSSVFAWHVLVTLFIQLVVHLACLWYGWSLALEFREKDYKRDLEGEFAPNLTNTVIFEIIAAMHASSFMANYEGHPFMQPLTSNRPLFYSMIFFVGVIFLCATEVMPDLNESLSLVPFPNDAFRNKISMLLAADIFFSVILSKSVDAFASWHRGSAAAKRAKELGLGMDTDESDVKVKKKKKKQQDEDI